MVGTFLKDDDRRVAIVTGYAGTGKTSALKMLAEQYGAPIVLTPTGKAALRVSEATGLPASTIHRFLYKAETDMKTGAPIFMMKDIQELGDLQGKLLLIDEASMVGKDLWADLNRASVLSGFKILLVGDTFQLPPVTKGDDAGFSALATETQYTVHLTEVVRQALDSPIIRASMLLRSNAPENEAMQLLCAMGASTFTENALDIRSRGGTVVCHTNARRHSINKLLRTALKYGEGTLEDGEPLLVTQNNYNLDRYNGEIVTFSSWDKRPSETMTAIAIDRFTVSSLRMEFGVGVVESSMALLSVDEITGKSEGAKIGNAAIKRAAKIAYKNTLGYDPYEEREVVPPYLHANYGHALTVHKSQGSEWNEVLVVIEDSLGALRGLERKRWMYTAITRAKLKTSYVYLQGRP